MVLSTVFVANAVNGSEWCATGLSASGDPFAAGQEAGKKAKAAFGAEAPALVLVYCSGARGWAPESNQRMLNGVASSFDKALIYGSVARWGCVAPESTAASVVVLAIGGGVAVTEVEASVVKDPSPGDPSAAKSANDKPAADKTENVKPADLGRTLGDALKAAYNKASDAKGRLIIAIGPYGFVMGTPFMKTVTDILGTDARMVGGLTHARDDPIFVKGEVVKREFILLLISGDFSCDFGVGSKTEKTPEEVTSAAIRSANGVNKGDINAVLVFGKVAIKTLTDAVKAPIFGCVCELPLGVTSEHAPVAAWDWLLSVCVIRKAR